MIVMETRFVRLSRNEAKKLHSILRDKHGNIQASSKITGLAVNTLKRAKEGLEITPENATTIREKLLNGSI